ncbi:MAG: hypothetical protein P8H03_05695 [Emcibacteraceae bacterium]|nr:hypothetical protein [Emcibacteraceae bacterium]
MKDYNYVPASDQNEVTLEDNINGLIENEINTIISTVTSFVKSNTQDYDFMDLLKDNGYVSVNDNWVKSYSNDNDVAIVVAS